MTVIGLLWSPLYLCATVETALCVFDSECESKAAPPALKQKCHAASLCARREPRGNQNIRGNFVDVRRPRSKRHLSFTKISKKSSLLYYVFLTMTCSCSIMSLMVELLQFYDFNGIILNFCFGGHGQNQPPVNATSHKDSEQPARTLTTLLIYFQHGVTSHLRTSHQTHLYLSLAWTCLLHLRSESCICQTGLCPVLFFAHSFSGARSLKLSRLLVI